MRNHSKQIEAFALQSTAGKIGNIIDLGPQNLVDDHADNFDSLLFKQRLIEAHLIDRTANAPLGDDNDLRAESPGDLCVRKIKNRADAGMAGAFAQHKLLLPGYPVERVL